jgi:hypothetical protein
VSTDESQLGRERAFHTVVQTRMSLADSMNASYYLTHSTAYSLLRIYDLQCYFYASPLPPVSRSHCQPRPNLTRAAADPARAKYAIRSVGVEVILPMSGRADAVASYMPYDPYSSFTSWLIFSSLYGQKASVHSFAVSSLPLSDLILVDQPFDHTLLSYTCLFLQIIGISEVSYTNRHNALYRTIRCGPDRTSCGCTWRFPCTEDHWPRTQGDWET